MVRRSTNYLKKSFTIQIDGLNEFEFSEVSSTSLAPTK